jgi:uncharacterized protein YccT (UPF0319 family)
MMNANKIVQFVLAVTLCLSFLGESTRAGVTLELAEDVTALVVNGKKARVEGDLSLPDGVNQIVVRYQGVLGRGGDMAYSDVFVVRFEAEHQTLKMVIPRITRESALDRFNREADIKIVDASGNRLVVKTAKLKKDGFQLSRDYEAEVALFNQTDSPAAVSTAPRSTSQVNKKVPVSRKGAEEQQSAPQIFAGAQVSEKDPAPSGAKAASEPSVNSDTAEEMLKYWYQQADQETRERFKRWIDE